MKRSWSQANADSYGQLGIIQSVSLKNFMCHDNLSFDFDPHINFIVGLNGSGKSAILTGIILALGGKSGATGRYSNIKGFVKTGKSSATVSVTLKNCGPYAYKPDEYGEKITTERHFTSDGVSTYKIKSEAGRIISNSKEELTNILDVMDIQIENPVTVLTQEISRSFLVSKNSKGDKLFQLFYRGTGLAKVHESYNRAVQQKEEAKEEVENKKSVLPDMETDIKTLRFRLDRTSKIAELKKEKLWAMVIKFEQDRDAALEARDKVKKEISKLNEELNAHESELGNVCQYEIGAQADKKVSCDKMESIRKDLEELSKNRRDLKSKIQELKGTYSRHEREVIRYKNDISSLENLMNEIRMKNQNDINEDKLKRESRLSDLENKHKDITIEISKMKTQEVSLRKSCEDFQKLIDNLQAEIQDINYEMRKILEQKQQLRDGMKSRINVFGSEIIKVLQEIDAGCKNGLFKVKPIGPIGLYINVKQPEWTFAVQECLKNDFLKAFLCDNHADAEQLTKIFGKYFHQKVPSIITTKFVSQMYDVSEHITRWGHPTVFDMLEFENPVIANGVIDQKRIENVLLIADPKVALDLMTSNVPDKRKSCYAYTPNGDQFLHSPFRKYACRTKNHICMLKTINEDDIRKIDEQIKLRESDILLKETKKRALQKAGHMKKQEIDNVRQKILQLNMKSNNILSEIKDVKDYYSEPKDINCLQSDLDQLNLEKSCHTEKFNSCKQDIISKSQELKILEAKVEECQELLQAERENYNRLHQDVEKHQNKKEQLNFVIRKMKSQLRQIEPDLELKETALSNIEATVKMATQNALKSCPRIDTTRSPDTINKILEETKNCIKEKNWNRETLLNEYQEKVEKLKKSKEELKKQEGINKRLGKMMAARFEVFQKICQNTSISLTCIFTAMLTENDFTGCLKINFDSKTLEIQATPVKTKSHLAKKHNLSQLSGGERSYVTIAFLLALWDRIHMPFRILDEYDVFMDSNNRHRSIHLLINAAKLKKKTQYIFLSPLELPPMEVSEHIKVHKMPPPRT